jgi:hypothetical protein
MAASTTAASAFQAVPSLRNVFLPHLMITRIVKDLREEDAVLLMDNCSAHLIPRDLPMCAWSW